MVTTVGLSKAYLDGQIKSAGKRIVQNDASKDQQNASSNWSSGEPNDCIDQTSAASKQLNDGKTDEFTQILPERLQLDLKEDWPVMVLSVTNSEIVVRLIEYTIRLDELIVEMQNFYNKKKLGKPVKSLTEIDRIYAAVFDGAVFRVRHNRLCDDRQVHCCHFRTTVCTRKWTNVQPARDR